MSDAARARSAWSLPRGWARREGSRESIFRRRWSKRRGGRSRTSGRAVELRTASVYALPFADGVFDAVRAERVFQHLDDPEAGLREMLRVTRAGGRVMVIDPDHGQAGLALDDPAQRRVYEALRRAMTRMIVNPHSGTRLRGMFVRAGLDDVAQIVKSFDFNYTEFMQMFFVGERLADGGGGQRDHRAARRGFSRGDRGTPSRRNVLRQRDRL